MGPVADAAALLVDSKSIAAGDGSLVVPMNMVPDLSADCQLSAVARRFPCCRPREGTRDRNGSVNQDQVCVCVCVCVCVGFTGQKKSLQIAVWCRPG